jgi:hypothetical protein
MVKEDGARAFLYERYADDMLFGIEKEEGSRYCASGPCRASCIGTGAKQEEEQGAVSNSTFL